MKRPDEIKKGLECCTPVWKGNHWKTCDEECPYAAEMVNCRTMLNHDALALIQQLESRNLAMYNTILSVMHFVDKWLDCPDYAPDADLNGVDAVQRAVKAREIALQAIDRLEAEREELIAGVVNIGGICSLCKHGLKRASQEPCNNCRALLNVKDSFFEWRGVQKED